MLNQTPPVGTYAPGVIPGGSQASAEAARTFRSTITSWIAEAQKAISGDRYDAAYERLVSAIELSPNAAQRLQIVTLAGNLDTKAAAWLKTADADLAAGKYNDAILRYRTLAGMSELKIGPQATARLIGIWFDEARDATDADRLDIAYSRLVSAMDLAVDGDVKEKLRAQAVLVDKKASAWLTQANADMTAGNIRDGLRRLRMLASMSDLKIGPQAVARMATAEKDPKMKAEVGEQRALAVFAPAHEIIHAIEGKCPNSDCVPDLTDVAVDVPLILKLDGTPRDRVLRAMGKLMTDHPDTGAGKWAARVQAKLADDKKFTAAADEDMARHDYETATAALRAKQTRSAYDQLHGLAYRYPKTIWTTRAAEDLKKPEFVNLPK
jgi:hypothetical protein